MMTYTTHVSGILGNDKDIPKELDRMGYRGVTHEVYRPSWKVESERRRRRRRRRRHPISCQVANCRHTSTNIEVFLSVTLDNHIHLVCVYV